MLHDITSDQGKDIDSYQKGWPVGANGRERCLKKGEVGLLPAVKQNRLDK